MEGVRQEEAVFNSSPGNSLILDCPVNLLIVVELKMRDIAAFALANSLKSLLRSSSLLLRNLDLAEVLASWCSLLFLFASEHRFNATHEASLLLWGRVHFHSRDNIVDVISNSKGASKTRDNSSRTSEAIQLLVAICN